MKSLPCLSKVGPNWALTCARCNSECDCTNDRREGVKKVCMDYVMTVHADAIKVGVNSFLIAPLWLRESNQPSCVGFLSLGSPKREYDKADRIRYTPRQMSAVTAFAGYFEMAMIATICWVIGLPVGWREVVEAFVVTTVALLYLLLVGNHMSVRFPAPSNPDRVSRAGASHGLRAAVQFLFFPLSLTPILVAFLYRYGWDSPSGYFWMMIAAGVLGAMLYTATFLGAAGYGQHKREALISYLSMGEGPIAAE